MARLARCTVPGYPHHVLQRGNGEQNVFEEEADYRHYLSLLKECAARYSVDIWAYCLMPNHVHIICVPNADGALARTFNTLHMRYAQRFNGKRSLHGHVWRTRFLSCVLDDLSVREEIRFIEKNPIRAKLVEKPEDYPWSSANAHIMRGPDLILSDGCFLANEFTDWRAYIEAKGDDSVLERTWSRLRTGRPAGGVEFVYLLEQITRRKLAAAPRGRPKKVLGDDTSG